MRVIKDDELDFVLRLGVHGYQDLLSYILEQLEIIDLVNPVWYPFPKDDADDKLQAAILKRWQTDFPNCEFPIDLEAFRVLVFQSGHTPPLLYGDEMEMRDVVLNVIAWLKGVSVSTSLECVESEWVLANTLTEHLKMNRSSTSNWVKRLPDSLKKRANKSWMVWYPDVLEHWPVKWKKPILKGG